jgi:xylan 1,4-beta-xylosidase
MEESGFGENEIVIHEEGMSFRSFFQNLRASPFHWHEDMEFLLILKGEIALYKDNVVYHLKPGDLAFINSHHYHSTQKISKENLILILQIQPDFIEKFEPAIKKMFFKFTYARDNKREQPPKELVQAVRSHICRIMWEKRTKNSGYKMVIESSLFSILGTLLRDVEHDIRSDQFSFSNQEYMDIHSRLKKIVDYIENNYQEKPSLEEIALQENITESYLSRFFKKYMDCGFRDYLNTFRLNKSLQKLIETEDSITNIAYDVGFSNLNTFNSLFHKFHGSTPSKWRQIHKKTSRGNESPEGWYSSLDGSSPVDSIIKYLQ